MEVIVNMLDPGNFYEFDNVSYWEEDDKTDWIKIYQEKPMIEGPNIVPGIKCLGWIKKNCIESIIAQEENNVRI